MQCPFCKEEMNEGATVCKVCARSQPLSPQQNSERTGSIWTIALGSIVGVVTVGVIGWQLADSLARSSAVDRIVQCARARGDKTVTHDFINYELDEMSNGQGWRMGEQVVKFQNKCFY